MTKQRIYLFDTTLRDGAQTPGIDFSVEDKIVIANMLDEFGLDYVEGGYPGANPTDTEFFGKNRTKKRHVYGLWHDQARRCIGFERPRTGGHIGIKCPGDLLCGEVVGLPCEGGSGLHQ